MKPAAPPAPPADAAAPHPRPILDIGDGLERIMGDRALYFKLLRRFLYDNQAVMRQLRGAIGAGRYQVAQLQVHSLKSAAGMIGARALYNLAARLEAALRAQALFLDHELQQLESALQQVLAIIPSILPELNDEHAAPLEAAPRPPDAAMMLLLERLADHLRAGDGAAIEILAQSASALAACLGVARYQAVAAAAHEFDFKTALAALLAA